MPNKTTAGVREIQAEAGEKSTNLNHLSLNSDDNGQTSEGKDPHRALEKGPTGLGKKIQRYKRKLLLSFNSLLLLVSIHGIIAHALGQQKALLLSYALTACALIPTLILIIKNRALNRCAIVLGWISILSALFLQASHGYESLIPYISAPAYIALCCVFFMGPMIYVGSGIIFASVCFGLFQLYNTPDAVITVSISSISETLLPATFISMLIVFYTFTRFRIVARKSVETAIQTKKHLEKANEKLESMINWQRLNTRSQIKLQHVGKLSGWWLDVKTRSLSISVRTANDDYTVMSTTLDENLKIDSSKEKHIKEIKHLNFWIRVVEPEIARAIESNKGWDIEAEEIHAGGASDWFRSIGEVELGENGVEYIFGVIQNISSAKALTKQLEYQANFDVLTELHNRRSLESLLHQKIQHADSDISSYYLFVDLDRFKVVNDTSGHLAGDELLRRVANIIKSSLRKTDIAGRIGGDEFGILLDRCDRDSAMAIANRIRVDIDALVFSWEDDQHRIGASIGAVRVNSDIQSIDDLQLLADSACLEAKSEGRNRVKLSDKDDATAEMRKGNSRWLQRLQEALRTENFALCAQEIKPVTTKNKNDKGEDEPAKRRTVEVLIRMRAKDGSLIAPGAFLPVAERFNLSTEIDLWVLKKVLQVAEQQRLADPTNVDAFWINLSGQSVSDEQFANEIYDLVCGIDLPVGTINFEITETAVIRDMKTAIALMNRLKAVGCSFALDDFGSGLASFGYLKQLPVDVIKIDGLFIKEINEGHLDRVFTKSIIDVAHAIGIQTVAEFVENDLIMEAVKDLGIDYMQGFGIHRPEEIELLATSEIDANKQKATA